MPRSHHVTSRPIISEILRPLAIVLAALCGPVIAAGERPGDAVYQERCASCHGAAGEGNPDEYPNPLIGDRSLQELQAYIDDTMPKGEPETLGAEDSARVAQFIYDAFYSPTAQYRNKPARVELSRLTVRQFRHSVADLIAEFTGRGDWNDERGLKGEYFNARRPREKRRVIERIDRRVDFHFGDKTPETEMIPSAEEYSARWEGSVIAPDDGDYEFIVETENGVELWVNDPNLPLIDASVKSGPQTEFRETRPLLGGRAYFLRLDLIKSKPEKTCSIVLKWKRPGHAAEIIPTRFLWPQTPPERLVLTTAFPPDDRSMGYERGTSISREWDEAATYAALEAAAWIAARRNALAGTSADADDRGARLREFATRFVERAFRRPLDEARRETYVLRQFSEAADEEAAIKRVVLLALKSPLFLYRDLFDANSQGPAVASRLALTLWDSIPDEPLWNAAANGQLQSRDQVQSQVARMLDDHRTRAKLSAFFEQWLKLDRIGELAKDAEEYPDFTPELVSDLRTSLELFLDDVAWSDRSDFRELFTSPSMYLNGRLSAFYGGNLAPDADFQKAPGEHDHRVGLLSHPYLLSAFAYSSTSSPIHRGVFITRSLLGRALRPPPVAVAPLAPDLHEGLTTRERVILQTSPETCQSCHGMINSLGFSLEHFDAVGRYREEDHAKPVDATGSYLSKSGHAETFHGAKDLEDYLAISSDSSEAFVTQLFQYAVKQPIRGYGAERPAALTGQFVAAGYSIRRLLGDIAVTAALGVPLREPTDPSAATAGP